MLARADLESLLRHRKLDRTLTTASLPDAHALAPTGLAVLDAHLGGGLPRGQVSEITGPPSSGRTSVLFAMLAAAIARGELAALVDTLDRFDVATGAAAGIDLSRLLWIRGLPGVASRGTRAVQQTGVDRALKALNLVLRCGNFGLVSLDVADVPTAALRQIPLTTWPRLQRIVEGTATTCVLLGSEPIARSAAGLTLMMRAVTHHQAQGVWSGQAGRNRLLRGLNVEIRIVRSRFGRADERPMEIRIEA